MSGHFKSIQKLNDWKNTVDTPSLLIYKDLVEQNIDNLIKLAGNIELLMPHIKTHKSADVLQLLISKGIKRFKASTIAEAEMAAVNGAKLVLLAHPITGRKINRFLDLIRAFPETEFAPIVDSKTGVDLLSKHVQKPLKIYIDINNGMNRTGCAVENVLKLMAFMQEKAAFKVAGFHVYDGHISDADFEIRKAKVLKGFEGVEKLFLHYKNTLPNLELIAGGSPSLTVHALYPERILSPGTFVFWDFAYAQKLKEQPFEPAVFVLATVISKPKSGLITIDLGHKAVAAENSIDKRIFFPENVDLELIYQSEEHGVLKTDDWEKYQIGDLLIGIPFHICPTVNLYQQAYVIEKGNLAGVWEILGGKRKISI